MDPSENIENIGKLKNLSKIFPLFGIALFIISNKHQIEYFLFFFLFNLSV